MSYFIYNFQVYIGRIATTEVIRDRLYLCIQIEQHGEIGPRHRDHPSTSQGLTEERAHRPAKEKGEPRHEPMPICQLIFNKGAKNTKWGKTVLFSNHHCESWMPTCKRTESDPYLVIHKYQLNLNRRRESEKFLGENTEEKLHVIGLGNDFLNLTPKEQTKKVKISK